MTINNMAESHHHHHHGTYHHWDDISSPSTPSPPYVATAPPNDEVSGSFESYPPPPPHSYPPPYVVYPCYYPPPWVAPHQPPLKPVEYVVNVKPTDVLCGRGGATNSHSGNRSFRSLVKRNQDRYLQAKKRDKPYVAAEIVDLIRKRGGRFLRRCAHVTPQGEVLWIDIGDERAKEKTCQALREGAPELRRRKREPSSGEVDELSPRKKASPTKNNEPPPQPTPCQSAETFKQSPSVSLSSATTTTAPTKVSPEARDDDDNRKEFPTEDELLLSSGRSSSSSPIVLRPCPRLMQRPVREIPLSELSPKVRNLYLEHFLPPHPSIRKSFRKEKVLTANQVYYPAATITRDEDSFCSDYENQDEHGNEEWKLE